MKLILSQKVVFKMLLYYLMMQSIDKPSTVYKFFARQHFRYLIENKL